MTPTEQDMERASDIIDETLKTCGPMFATDYDVLQANIASLISQVRNETLDDAHMKIADLEGRLLSHKNKNRFEHGRLIGLQNAIGVIRNLKQEDKEHE